MNIIKLECRVLNFFLQCKKREYFLSNGGFWLFFLNFFGVLWWFFGVLWWFFGVLSWLSWCFVRMLWFFGVLFNFLTKIDGRRLAVGYLSEPSKGRFRLASFTIFFFFTFRLQSVQFYPKFLAVINSELNHLFDARKLSRRI